MNIRCVLKQFALLVLSLSALLVVTGTWSLYRVMAGDADEGAAALSLMLAAGLGAICGAGIWMWTHHNRNAIGRREAMLLVAMTWLLGAAISAVPFFLWAHLGSNANTVEPFDSYVDAYFEAMSGLTTTGATIITDIPAVPRSLLMWRSLTHWLGGLGIVVLFVAVLPSLGVGGKKLFHVESARRTSGGVRPQIRETARVLWLIYLGMTAAEIVLLKLAGMTWYDSVAHTFSTLATGGFSTHNASIGAYQSGWIDVIVIVFMVLAGINFGLYYLLIRRRWRNIWTDTELRVYLSAVAITSVIVCSGLVGRALWTISDSSGGEPGIVEASVVESARYGVFQLVSIHTGTGFCTADYNHWDFLPKAVLVMLMFVGASSGSTCGGIKVFRFIILFKILWVEIERIFRPNVVRTIKVGKSPVDSDLRQSTLAYILGVFLLFGIGTVGLMLLEADKQIDVTTAATASAATLNNIGPGLARVGATENYAWFSAPSKILMSLLMVLGRLEVFAIIVLFNPRFWRTD